MSTAPTRHPAIVCAARPVSSVTTRAAAADNVNTITSRPACLVGGGDRAQHRRLAGPGGSDDRRHPAAATGDLVDRGDLVVAERRVADRVDGERGPVLGGGWSGLVPRRSGSCATCTWRRPSRRTRRRRRPRAATHMAMIRSVSTSIASGVGSAISRATSPVTWARVHHARCSCSSANTRSANCGDPAGRRPPSLISTPRR